MQQITALETRMDRYLELEDDDDLLDELLQLAREHPQAFIDYVDAQPIGPPTYRPVLYEAIADELTGWEGFRLAQIRVAFEAASRSGADAEEILSSVFYLTGVYGLAPDFYTAAIEYLSSKLADARPDVRMGSLEYLLDLHTFSRIDLSGRLRRRLTAHLADAAYRVRTHAYLELKDANKLPTGFRLRWTDRIRHRFDPWYRQRVLMKTLGGEVAARVGRGEL